MFDNPCDITRAHIISRRRSLPVLFPALVLYSIDNLEPIL